MFSLDQTFSTIIEADLATPRIVPALMGDPGIGKTSFIKDLGNRSGMAVFVVSVNTLADKGDLTGVRTVPTPDGKDYHQRFFPHETIREASIYAENNPDETVIVLLDEINRTPDPGVTTAALSLVTERKAGHLVLADNVRFVVTGNTEGNISHLDSASLTRFAIYKVKADASIFLDLMGESCHPWVRTVLEADGALISGKPDDNPFATIASDDDDDDDDNASAWDALSSLTNEENMTQQANPRTIEGVSNWLHHVSDDQLRQMLMTFDEENNTYLRQVLVAHTGDTPFTAKLESVIADDLIRNSASNNTNMSGAGANISINVPSFWRQLTLMSSRDFVALTIQKMSVDEKSELLVYLMYANSTGTDIIYNIVISNDLIDEVNKSALRNLVSMASMGLINDGYVSQIDQSNALSTALASIRSIL